MKRPSFTTIKTALSGSLWRWLLLLILAFVTLQLYFVLRVALMVVVDPQSTTFERSEAWRIVSTQGRLPWRQEWRDYGDISNHLKRAVIAAEDGEYIHHSGVEWEAIENAWERNARAEKIAQAAQEKAEQRAQQQAQRRVKNSKAGDQVVSAIKPPAKPVKPVKPPKIVGGSTITQQLAKNLFLSGERNLLRKGQEFMLTQLLELFLSKQRILEIYLNSVEWGEGVFGAEAAAQHYYRKSAAQLSSYEAARLAVMLPRPKFFEKRTNSGYLSARASTIVARMGDAELP